MVLGVDVDLSRVTSIGIGVDILELLFRLLSILLFLGIKSPSIEEILRLYFLSITFSVISSLLLLKLPRVILFIAR